jgi:putative colanic acid biosynthesis UDP-glucose lipid carrier transferase
LEEMVLEHKISETWICLSFKEEESYTRVLFNLRNTTCDILRIPSANDLILMDRKVSIVDGLQLIDISCLRQNGIDRFMKAAEDYTVASLSILLLSPMIVVICLLVKFSSPGPIFFKQYRHGLDGKRFKVYKFRTMVVHDEADGKTTQAVKGDSRVTPIGSILRRSSLDELPQLMNVLQGRMSIVGPRPHALDHNYHFKDLIDSYMRRHIVKPGLTGWAQIHGFRGETDTIDKMRKRVELDLYYIENWSLVLDVKILLLTPWKLLVDSNAY